MAFWIVWFIIGLVFVAVFTVLAIPRIMLKTHAATLPVRDKVTERFSNEHGAIFVYTPCASARKFIKSYRIAHDEKGLFFQGEWACKNAFIEYELTVYNAESDILEILHIKEKFNGRHKTHITRLPPKADYVSLRIVCADDEPLTPERSHFNARYAIWLSVLCVSIAATVDILVWLVMLFIIRCMDNFTMTLSLPANVWAGTLIVTAITVMGAVAILSLGKFFLTRKKGDSYET